VTHPAQHEHAEDSLVTSGVSPRIAMCYSRTWARGAKHTLAICPYRGFEISEISL